MSEARLKVVVDCDTGVDDADALLILLSQPNIDIVGITCVAGNTSLDNVVRNTKYVLKVCQREDIPIFKGATCSLMNRAVSAPLHIHGSEGLGTFIISQNNLLKNEDGVSEEPAASALIRLSKKYKGNLCLLALAPLTNIALAVRMCPEIFENLSRVVVMGGNYQGIGNSKGNTEFNFKCDPEAAEIVFSQEKGMENVFVLPWETCYNQACTFMEEQWFNKWACLPENMSSLSEISLAQRQEFLVNPWSLAKTFPSKFEFLSHLKRPLWFMRFLDNHRPYNHSCDGAAACMILESVIDKYDNVKCCIETQGMTAGQVVVDSEAKRAGINMVTHLHTSAVREIFEAVTMASN